MTKSEKRMHCTFSIVQTEVEKWRRGKKSQVGLSDTQICDKKMYCKTI